jgi:hypothetical protein
MHNSLIPFFTEKVFFVKAGDDENESGKCSVVAESSNKEQHKKSQSESQVENDDPCPD